MADVYSKSKRSQVMSRIRGRGNKDTEIVLAKLLRLHKITGWRRHYAIVGKPDFVFPKQKIAIFVDGCFWHGCPKHFKMPSSNLEYWVKKLDANKRRDRQVTKSLRTGGWIVFRIWEHALAKRGEACIYRIKTALEDTVNRLPR
jgi:DNA mismatch endonuclease (patch repair protein)